VSWWALAAPVAAIAALLLGPGWVLLRASGVRGLLALAAAPAVSLAYLGLAGLVLDRAGLRWGWGPLALGLVPLAAVAWLCGRWLRRSAAGRRLPGPWSRRHRLGGRRSAVLAGALLAAAATFLVPYLLGLGAPDAVVQQWDAVFHASGVQLVRETGNASVLGAMAGQYGAAPAGVYYPAVWHGLVSLAPGSVALVTNASVVVLGALVWPLGLAGLGRVLTGRWSLTVWTPVLGAAFGLFPSRILVELSQFPLGTALAAVPGALAVWIAAVRTAPGEPPLGSRARCAVSGLVLATTAAGVAAAHGAGLFSFLLLVGPAALLRLVRELRRWWRAGRRRHVAGVLVLLGLLVVTGVGLALASPTFRAVASYTYDTHDPVPVTLYRTLFDLPTAPVVPGLWPLALLTVLGAVRLARRGGPERERWLLWSAAAVLLVTSAAAGGLGPVRVLAGPWYSQTPRVAAVFPVVAAPLAALGLHALAGAIGRRLPALARSGPRAAVDATAAVLVVLACVLTLGWSAPWKAERGSRYTLPGPVQWGTMLSEEELALLRRLPRTTPPDAVILGDPANGAAFAWSVAHRRVVFPQLDPSNESPDQRVLRFGFHQLMTEPAVCEAVRALGVTHFYQDTATVAEGAKVSEDATGLVTPVTEEMLAGLEVVDRGGTATLYRITAC